MNYGESLVYWCLRLNGFFLIQDFVLHEGAANRSQPSDIDLLGVRFPHVLEAVGGREDDWDRYLEQTVNERFFISPTAVVAEVKTGKCTNDKIEESFSEARVCRALGRLGIWKETLQLCETLANVPSVTTPDGWIIAKVAVTRSKIQSPLCHLIPLSHVDEFIRHRIETYRDSKYPHRLRFHDPLM